MAAREVPRELFGHAKGAFSGATRSHEGSFGAADGGTLFLDEVGELPLAAQPKLLRALESRVVRRVGEAEHRPVDVRVADLMRAIEARPWLGNARELRNFVERAEAIGPDRALASMPGPATASRIPSVDLDEPFKQERDRCLEHLERVYLEGWLARKRWNVSAVAEAMGLDRSYVHRLIKKHDLSRDE